jgi:hypothetical protein
MEKNAGRIVYGDWAVKLKPRVNPLRKTVKVLLVIALLIFLYKRYIRK